MNLSSVNRLCKVCMVEIPQVRLEVLPNTQTCVAHSCEKPKRAFIEGTSSHKGFNIVILEGDDPTVDYWEDRQYQY